MSGLPVEPDHVTALPSLARLPRRRWETVFGPLVPAVAGTAALITGRLEAVYDTIVESFAIEFFVTTSFPLVIYAAMASPRYGISRRAAWSLRTGAIALFLLAVVWPVAKQFGPEGLIGFVLLILATYPGCFSRRGFDVERLNAARILYPLGAWWSCAVLLVIVSGSLRAMGFEAGELVIDNTGEPDYTVWPLGWLVCCTLYFSILSVLEATGAYDRPMSLLKGGGWKETQS